jgi:hypothetical protein
VITQAVDCGSKIAMSEPESYTIGASVINFLNSGNPDYPNTVMGLYKLANAYLGGLRPGNLSASEVSGAVDAINNAFDECRIITGWEGMVQTATTITRTETQPVPAGNSKEVGMVEVQGLSVATFPNPFVDKVRFVLKSEVSGPAQIELVDMQGRIIQNAYKGFIMAGREQVVDVNVNTVSSGALIYKVRIGNKIATGKLLRIAK